MKMLAKSVVWKKNILTKMSFGHKQVLYFKWNTPKFYNHTTLYNHWQLENI